MKRKLSILVSMLVPTLFVFVMYSVRATRQPRTDFLGSAEENAQDLVTQGRDIFRYDTFGDEIFWTDVLGLNQLVAGTTPRQAIDLGLKVDIDALPKAVIRALKAGTVNLDDPAVTVQLVQQRAVLGVIG